jgi:hypothetical protein
VRGLVSDWFVVCVAQAGKSSLLDVEAEEEEEEDMLKGLEDFGFGAVNKEAQKAQALGEENEDVELRDDDFENIVDALSDGEGDEDAGRNFAVQKVRFCVVRHGRA